MNLFVSVITELSWGLWSPIVGPHCKRSISRVRVVVVGYLAQNTLKKSLILERRAIENTEMKISFRLWSQSWHTEYLENRKLRSANLIPECSNPILSTWISRVLYNVSPKVTFLSTTIFSGYFLYEPYVSPTFIQHFHVQYPNNHGNERSTITRIRPKMVSLASTAMNHSPWGACPRRNDERATNCTSWHQPRSLL